MALNSDGPEKLRRPKSRWGSNAIGGNSSSTKGWNDVPRGTMDEVSSHVRLDPPTRSARPSLRLIHLVFESHDGSALVPIPKRARARERRTTAVVDSLKALTPTGRLEKRIFRDCGWMSAFGGKADMTRT